jgi:hypothetical protein
VRTFWLAALAAGALLALVVSGTTVVGGSRPTSVAPVPGDGPGAASNGNNARFGYYWRNNTLPYDTELSYFFDVSVYPEGIFADCSAHDFAYVTAVNKHIVYNSVPYGVELVLQYGFYADNAHSVKRVWVQDHDDPLRFASWWISNDADGADYWELSTLANAGYLGASADAAGDELQFLRVLEQTVFVSESPDPAQSTWANKFYFYDFASGQWELKMTNTFVIPASREDVRSSTHAAGSNTWAGILETFKPGGGTFDANGPPVKKVVYRNRSVRVVDRGVATTPALDDSNNAWFELEPGAYQTFYRSQPVYSEYAAGGEDATAQCAGTSETALPPQPPTATPTATPTFTPTRTRTSTPTRTATATRASRSGDANCDGAVTSLDAVLILQLDARLIDELGCQQNTDVNRDRRTNSLDAVLVLWEVAGL